ncbi:unnamed protein product [Sphagnum jensenii]|uniref:Uncharacterized protein n=1 Tax=Sphagnum jensenii TaxID=128206 RepID=A0ABP1BMM9_9BRYO
MDKDHGMEFPNALGTYISKGVRGVKDDCQRFRLEMQMLKEKAEDTRKREAEVEGMANRVKRRLMEEQDVVAHRNLDTLMQPSQIVQPSTTEREDLEDVLGGGNPGAASFNCSAIRRRNPCAHDQQFSMEESVGKKGPQKKLKDHKIDTSASDSSPCTVSSLPSFPLIGCSQRLYKTAFTAAEYCTPVHPLHHQLHLGSTLEPDSEVSKGQYHPNSTNAKYSNNRGPESADLPSPNSTAIVLPTPLLNHNLSRYHELGPQCNARLQVYCNQHVSRSPLSKSTLCHLADTHQQVEAKRSIQKEVKGKLGELMAATAAAQERMSGEKEQVQALVDERIEKRLNEKDLVMAEMKSNMRLLWAEVEALNKGRDHLQEHVNHLTKSFKSNAGCSSSQVNSETERGNLLLQTVEKLKYEGADLKLEMKDLKKVEKAVKVELESVRKLAAKMQEDSEELERERGSRRVEGVRERLLIMEKVESLSHLYLGGLEEVRADVFNVKLSCRDRVDKLEDQWKEFQQQQQETAAASGDELGSVPQQVLLDDLENLRSEMGRIVETERGILQQALERESGSIRRQLKDACIDIKCEMMSAVKAEVKKRLQKSQDKTLAMTVSVKQEIKDLKLELSVAAAGKEGPEGLPRALSVVEKHKQVAAKAAADATISATKAANFLTEMLGSFSMEIANTRWNSLQLQENLATERDMAAAAAAEAIKVSKELAKVKEHSLIAVAEAQNRNQEVQQYLERETSKLLNAMSAVHKEKHVASLAASEASASALRAQQVLAELLGSFNSEMAKAQKLTMQLQEGLEREKDSLEHERELAIQHTHEVQNHFGNELEFAIAGWRHTMNAEVAKAKDITQELQEEKRWVSSTLKQQQSLMPNLMTTSHQMHEDMTCNILKMEDTLNTLSQTVEQIQESQNHLNTEKKWCLGVIQEEIEQQERDWKVELTQLNQVVHMLEKSINDSAVDQSDIAKKIEKLEGTQVDLVHLCEEVRISTDELAKSAAIWYPKYEAAACIVSELSFKLEQTDEKIRGIYCDENLLQHMAQLAESKVLGLKDMVSSSVLAQCRPQLQNILEQVENEKLAHREALDMLSDRVKGLETVVGSTNWPSLNMKHSKKIPRGETIDSNEHSVRSLNQAVQVLQRRVELLALDHNGVSVAHTELTMDSKFVGLETRIEHVASATFSNFRVLDEKLLQTTLGVQSAIAGAAMADSKCGALGAELVKVFRMLASCNKTSLLQKMKDLAPACQNGEHRRRLSPTSRTCKDDHISCAHSPTCRSSGHIQLPSMTNRDNQLPPMGTDAGNTSAQAFDKRGTLAAQCKDTVLTKRVKSSEMRKTIKQQKRGGAEGRQSSASEQGGSPRKERWTITQQYLEETDNDKSHNLQNQAFSIIEKHRQGAEPGLNGHLTIRKTQEGSGKNNRRTDIHLDAGHVHVNVSHHSAIVHHSQRREET